MKITKQEYKSCFIKGKIKFKEYKNCLEEKQEKQNNTEVESLKKYHKQ